MINLISARERILVRVSRDACVRAYVRVCITSREEYLYISIIIDVFLFCIRWYLSHFWFQNYKNKDICNIIIRQFMRTPDSVAIIDAS